jgi:hypothetical protein
MLRIDLDGILRAVAAAAERREAIAPALRSSGVPGAEAIAERLERGETLPAALAGIASPEVCDLLAGPRPPLAQAALLAAEDLRIRRQRRQLLIDALSYPVTAMIVLLGSATWLWLRFDMAPAATWLWLLLPGLALVAAVPVLASLNEGLAVRLGTLTAWNLHARRAARYERAALVARWRLPEAEAVRVLGDELPPVAGVLGHPEAERHCRDLAAYHRTAAGRGARRLALVLSIGLYLMAGAVAAALFGGLADRWLAVLAEFAGS